MTKKRFNTTLYAHYREHGRHHLPWRQTQDPYTILVSEIMLQQTQVDRVIAFYTRFIEAYPTVERLALAPLGDVLRLWQGLGYNRRAKMLHECAKTVVRDYGGMFPKSYDALRSLPGIGPYTAGAVMAFAYNLPVPIIETNIRTVFLHHFFSDTEDVHDKELMPLIEKMLDTNEPRRWYAALMDYGSHLKRTVGNVSQKSRHHVRQSKFKGSDREIRGAILKMLAQKDASEESIIATLGFERIRTTTLLSALEHEGMIVRHRGVYRLP